MKRLILILVLQVLFRLDALSQQTFFTFFPSVLNAVILDMIEDQYGNYLAVGQQRISNDFSTNRGTLWRITSQGDTLSKNFSHGGDTSTGFVNIIHSEDFYCTILGGITLHQQQNFSYMMILHIDSSLNVVEKKFIAPPETIGASALLVVELMGNYYCIGSSVNLDGVAQHSIMKLDNSFDIIGFQTYSFNGTRSFTGSFMDVIISPDSTQLWAFGYNLTPDDQSNCDMVVFDTLLNFVEIKPFPFGEYPNWSQFEDDLTARLLNDSTFLVGGQFWYQNYPEPSQIDIGFCKFDSSLVFKPVTVFGAIDTIDAGGFKNTFDFISNDSIFFTGMKRTGGGLYPTSPSWIHVGLINNNMNPYYVRYYGGDAFYWVNSILATSDGGALIAGDRYDYLTQGYERDAFFLKVNRDGLVTSSKHEPYCPYLPFTVYPNPGNDYPIINLASQNAFLRVYNISGQMILSITLKEGANQVDFSRLPNGSYILSIVDQNGEVFSKKWIKY